MTPEVQIKLLMEIADNVLHRGSPSQPGPKNTLTLDRYFSQERFEKECVSVFRKTWLMIGRGASLGSVGSYFTAQVTGTPIIVIRQSEKKVQAFYNVCSHRGSALRRCKEGTLTKLDCPFHGWTYDLEGKLLNVTDRADFPGLDPNAKALQSIKTEEWGGFVWVNLDPQARPLLEYLGEVAKELSDEGLESLVQVKSSSTQYRANWKLGVELFTEAYHSQVLHRYTVNPILDQSGTHLSQLGIHSRIILPRRRVTKVMRELGAKGLITPQLLREALPSMVSKGSRALYGEGSWSLRALSNTSYGIFPNLIILLLPNSFMTMQFWPLDEKNCCYEFGIYAPKVETYEQELFVAGRIKTWVDVSGEDTSNLEALQRGMESAVLTETTFGFQEQLIPKFHASIDAYIGDET